MKSRCALFKFCCDKYFHCTQTSYPLWKRVLTFSLLLSIRYYHDLIIMSYLRLTQCNRGSSTLILRPITAAFFKQALATSALNPTCILADPRWFQRRNTHNRTGHFVALASGGPWSFGCLARVQVPRSASKRSALIHITSNSALGRPQPRVFWRSPEQRRRTAPGDC